MTVIILAVIIVLLASISGWNYYQTNKKISSLLINNSTLQSNYRVEISTLEGITKQAQTELLEQRKLISERKKRKVFKVRPGITGLAQISGINMKTPTILAKTDQKMIKEMSLNKYFYYIFRTILQILIK